MRLEGGGGEPPASAETNSPWSGQLVASLWAEGLGRGGEGGGVAPSGATETNSPWSGQLVASLRLWVEGGG